MVVRGSGGEGGGGGGHGVVRGRGNGGAWECWGVEVREGSGVIRGWR